MACGGVQDDPKAVISCFVRQEETVYAVVCKHITATANRHFHVHGLKSTFAKRIRKKKKVETPTFTDFDIDLITVEKKHIKKCNSIFWNSEGEVKQGRVFEGEVSDFKDCEVFTSYRNEKTLTGKVLHSSQIDKTIAESYNMDTHFVVGGDSFSIAGDSGRVVAFKDAKCKDGFFELVGIIVHKTGDQTVCLKLHKGLEYLSKEYGLQLSLLEPERCDGNYEKWIVPGDAITFYGLKNKSKP